MFVCVCVHFLLLKQICKSTLLSFRFYFHVSLIILMGLSNEDSIKRNKALLSTFYGFLLLQRFHIKPFHIRNLVADLCLITLFYWFLYLAWFTVFLNLNGRIIFSKLALPNKCGCTNIKTLIKVKNKRLKSVLPMISMR